MLFKLAFKNMAKSIKDYSIYFLTLVLGVAIFYMFNSLDSQQAMLEVSKSTREIIELMIRILSIVSVFVAVVLGLLIVYANNFLINRRKKEFGIYMTLGMGRRQISKIILIETIFIGIISLLVGLILGIFASQLMSVFVAKMFEADMTSFEFVFSKAACIETCIYFAVMYLAVILFNAFTVSRYRLIRLINANKHNEKIKMRNPFWAVIVFLFGSIILGYAYYIVTKQTETLRDLPDVLRPILMGIIGTLAVFWSLSGFFLLVIQKMKNIYLKGTNLFVLRQINHKINTTVISMSVICIMLFMTITILSSSLAMHNSMQQNLLSLSPVDINIIKRAYLKETGDIIYDKEVLEDSKLPIMETLKNHGFEENTLKDVVEIPIYEIEGLNFGKFLGNQQEHFEERYTFLAYGEHEEVIKISDYNRVARLYGKEEYNLKENEYIVLCNYQNIAYIRNQVLSSGNTLTIAEKEYVPKYSECKDGFLEISNSRMNTGIIIVPDSCNLQQEMISEFFLAANYNTDNDKEKIEEMLDGAGDDIIKQLREQGINIRTSTKISLADSSVGISSIVIFIAIYLGIIFLIASSVILALKQLTDSSDNKQRYIILRKIGCDEKMINRTLFKQIGIFFGLPLLFAIIHSIFGIQFALIVLEGLTNTEELLPSIIVTIILMGFIYGSYFLATYLGSKNIIKKEE